MPHNQGKAGGGLFRRSGKRLLAAALGLLLLSGCSGFSTGNFDDLLTAPRLNERQMAVVQAMEATMSLSDIAYKYPQSGDNRSPFLFFDLDGDGLEEAIVFYAYVNNPSDLRARVLAEQADGSWTPVYDIPGNGDEVDFVEFASLLDPEDQCMVIGWKSSRRSVVGVYSFTSRGFREEILQSYVNWDIQDYNGDGVSEIVTVSQDRSGTGTTYRVSLFSRGLAGGLEEVDAVLLPEETDQILQVLNGSLWGGATGIYVDLQLLSGYTATSIIRVAGNRLESLAGQEEMSNFSSTFREHPMLCVDLYGDGVVEVPVTDPLGIPVEGDDTGAVMLTEYLQLTREGFGIAYTAAVNEDDRYLIFLPQAWIDQVMLVHMPELREWQFYRLDNGAPGMELLRIRVYTVNDYQDMFADYFLLAENGPLQYYGYIPPLREGDDRELAVTENLVRNRMFYLM